MTQKKLPRKAMATRANAVKPAAVQQAKTPTAVVKNRLVARVSSQKRFDMEDQYDFITIKICDNYRGLRLHE